MTLTLKTAASGAIRDNHWVLNPVTSLYERTTLLEKAFTNKRTTALGSFLTAGATITSTTEPDPAGGTTAVEVTATAGTGSHLIRANQTSAIGLIAGEAWIQAGTYTYGRVFFNNATDGNVNICAVDLTTGAITYQAGLTGFDALVTVRDDGWVRIQIFGAAQNIANSGIIVAMTANTGLLTFTAVGTETIKVWAPSLFEDVICPVSVLDASAAQPADVTYDANDFAWTPQQATGYYRFFEAGGVLVTDSVVAHGGSGTPGEDPRIVIKSNGTYYQATHDNGTTESTSTATAAPTMGQLVELRVSLGADGAMQLHQSIDQATEVDETAGSAATLQAAWAGTRHYLGSEAGANGGLLQLTHAAWFPGDVSLANCRAWAGG